MQCTCVWLVGTAMYLLSVGERWVDRKGTGKCNRGQFGSKILTTCTLVECRKVCSGEFAKCFHEGELPRLEANTEFAQKFVLIENYFWKSCRGKFGKIARHRGNYWYAFTHHNHDLGGTSWSGGTGFSLGWIHELRNYGFSFLEGYWELWRLE